MKHIFFIDPLENLNIKKDSSLLLADTFLQAGHEVFLLFAKDLYFANNSAMELAVHSFKITKEQDNIALKSCELLERSMILLDQYTFIHMRLDPPFDSRYLRYLWILETLRAQVKAVVNDPLGIMNNNEKLLAFKQDTLRPDSYVGESLSSFQKFINWCRENKYSEIIIKPMDSFSGIGVEKFSLDNDIDQDFIRKTQSSQGPVIAQPFYQEVYSGEHRVVLFKSQHLGTIIKIPAEGQFLSNIAQGATYLKSQVKPSVMNLCQKISAQLDKEGVPLVAFDILGDRVTEVNVTCPGLLVEVSKAYNENLCQHIVELF